MNAKVEEVDLMAAAEAGMQEEPKQEQVIEPDWTTEQAAEAEAMGWIPPERSGKLPEGKSFVGPVEYMKRNPLYSKVKELESGLSRLNEHYQKVSEVEHEKAKKAYEDRIAELEAQKIEALDNAEHAKVVEIDKELRSTKEPEAEKQQDSSDFQEWVKENDWYENDSFLRIEATKVGEILYSDKLYGKPLLNAVKEHLKQAYPDKFKNPERDKPSPVEGASARPTGGSKKATEKDLTADERTIYRNFKNLGVFKEEGSVQKYIDEVIALRD